MHQLGHPIPVSSRKEPDRRSLPNTIGLEHQASKVVNEPELRQDQSIRSDFTGSTAEARRAGM